MGDYMVSLFPPKSIRGIFVEDNQATIRILENGKSPSFRHTDKTQRINLSWLSEQYKRGWYDLTYGPSKMQVADILTKPFTNAEKWRFALALMSHVAKVVRPVHPVLLMQRLVHHGPRLWHPVEAPGNREPA